MQGHSPARRVAIDETKVRKFSLYDEKKKFKHLSDHYGVSTVIFWRQKTYLKWFYFTWKSDIFVWINMQIPYYNLRKNNENMLVEVLKN